MAVPNGVMEFHKTSFIDESCHQLRDVAGAHDVTLIVSFNTLYDQMFGCSCLYKDFPLTLVTYHERRTWRFEEEEHAVHKNILLIGNPLPGDSFYILDHDPHVQKLASPDWFDKNIYLITDNHLRTLDLLRKYGIGFRKYK
ncbi:MAG: hypothetical protein LH473_03745 [Chitinophagales bacterium]|nr:hypothetical protein [Chitinophagales bacterium]